MNGCALSVLLWEGRAKAVSIPSWGVEDVVKEVSGVGRRALTLMCLELDRGVLPEMRAWHLG